MSKTSIESTEDPWCDSTNPRLIEFEEVEKAQEMITPGIIVTPCIRSRLSELLGMEVYMKLELMQRTGSFKERGARYTMMNLSDEEKAKGIVAASLGNHSQGCSLHGRELGIPVTVVMPVVAPLVKVEKCRRYGANVVLQGNNMAEAKRIAMDLGKAEGLTFINGYDHPHVIAGQGVIGIEIIEQIGEVDAVIVPVGGGGLIAGVAVAIKHLSPMTEVIGVEAEVCAGFTEALKYGRPHVTKYMPSLADGLQVPKVGYNSFRTAKEHMDHMITVSEDLLDVAILHMVEYEKIAPEGAGASPLAAIYSGKLNHLKGKKVCFVVSGGNIDVSMLGRVLQRGLAVLGRYIKFSVWVVDRPGGISDMTAYITENGATIKDLYCERAWLKDDNYNVKVTVMCEVKDIDAAVELKSAIESKYEKTDFTDFPCINMAKQIMNFNKEAAGDKASIRDSIRGSVKRCNDSRCRSNRNK